MGKVWKSSLRVYLQGEVVRSSQIIQRVKNKPQNTTKLTLVEITWIQQAQVTIRLEIRSHDLYHSSLNFLINITNARLKTLRVGLKEIDYWEIHH